MTTTRPTTVRRRPSIGGNWKMNLDRAGSVALAESLARALADVNQRADVAVFVPFPYLTAVASALAVARGTIALGAQDACSEKVGAFTGEVSVDMLRDCAATVCLVGHSERRHVLGESDTLINKKLRAVIDGGLEAVLCVGETLAQREAGETDAVNERQLRAGLAGVSPAGFGGVTIAYEPVWAIGTGRTATPADAQAAHAKARAVLTDLYGREAAERTRIQYGGSVKSSNAAELLAQPDIDGALVGGASLDAPEFVRIVQAAIG